MKFFAAAHGPLFVEVSVKMIVPAAMSPAVIEYVVDVALIPPGNVPVPLVVQLPVPALPPTNPLSATGFCVEQMSVLVPALTIGALNTLILTVSSTDPHALPRSVEVSVNNTNPFEMSVGVRLYAVLSVVEFGLNPPEPFALHTPVLAVLITVPVKATLPDAEHTGMLAPAFTSGYRHTRTATVSFRGGQTPLLVEVRVKITTPALISPALKL
jgi:hypothetical protein